MDFELPVDEEKDSRRWFGGDLRSTAPFSSKLWRQSAQLTRLIGV